MKAWHGVALFLALVVVFQLGYLMGKGKLRLPEPSGPGYRVVLQCVPENADQKWTMEDEIRVLRGRIDALGVKDPVIRAVGADKLEIRLPKDVDKDEALSYLTTTGLLRFVYIKGIQSDRHPTGHRYEVRTNTDDNGRESIDLFDVRDGGEVVDLVDFFDNHKDQYEVVVTGADLVNRSIRARIEPSGTPYIALTFDIKGTREFSDFTRAHLQDILAIEMDKAILSAPSVKAHIRDGHAQITGGFESIDEAQQLATLLRAGALPVPLKVVEAK